MWIVECGFVGDPGFDFAAELVVGIAYENDIDCRLPGVFAAATVEGPGAGPSPRDVWSEMK